MRPAIYVGKVPAEVVTVTTVETLLRLAEDRIRARKATRREWRSYRRLIRIYYGQPRHRNAHRRRATIEAKAELRTAMVVAIMRESMRRQTAAVLLMTAAFQELGRGMVLAMQRFRKAIQPLEGRA